MLGLTTQRRFPTFRGCNNVLHPPGKSGRPLGATSMGMGETEIYEGDYAYFEWKRREERTQCPNASNEDAEKEGRRRAFEQKREAERSRARAERRLAEIEHAIHEVERELAQIEALLKQEDVASDWDRLDGLLRAREEGEERLEGLYDEWERVEA